MNHTIAMVDKNYIGAYALHRDVLNYSIQGDSIVLCKANGVKRMYSKELWDMVDLTPEGPWRPFVINATDITVLKALNAIKWQDKEHTSVETVTISVDFTWGITDQGDGGNEFLSVTIPKADFKGDAPHFVVGYLRRIAAEWLTTEPGFNALEKTNFGFNWGDFLKALPIQVDGAAIKLAPDTDAPDATIHVNHDECLASRRTLVTVVDANKTTLETAPVDFRMGDVYLTEKNYPQVWLIGAHNIFGVEKVTETIRQIKAMQPIQVAVILTRERYREWEEPPKQTFRTTIGLCMNAGIYMAGGADNWRDPGFVLNKLRVLAEAWLTTPEGLRASEQSTYDFNWTDLLLSLPLCVDGITISNELDNELPIFDAVAITVDESESLAPAEVEVELQDKKGNCVGVGYANFVIAALQPEAEIEDPTKLVAVAPCGRYAISRGEEDTDRKWVIECI